MKLTEWLDEAILENESKYYTFRRALELNNGVVLSIQASEGAYSTPRVNGLKSEDYTHFEIGFPTERIDLLIQYAEDQEKPTDTVYPYTPINVIEQVVKEAGGVKGLRKLNLSS